MAIRSGGPPLQPRVSLSAESQRRSSEFEPHLGRVNLWESDSHLVLATPVPGAQADDLHVRLSGRVLEIDGRARAPDPMMEQHHVAAGKVAGGVERRYYMREWLAGEFSRQVELPLPVQAFGAEASLGNGVLVIALPKTSETARGGTQEIPVVRRELPAPGEAAVTPGAGRPGA